MALDHVNVYVIDEGDSWTIIDTGFWSKKTQSIWSQIKEKWFSDKPIGKVIVTHHHPDHIGLAGWLSEKYNAEIILSLIHI